MPYETTRSLFESTIREWRESGAGTVAVRMFPARGDDGAYDSARLDRYCGRDTVELVAVQFAQLAIRSGCHFTMTQLEDGTYAMSLGLMCAEGVMEPVLDPGDGEDSAKHEAYERGQER